MLQAIAITLGVDAYAEPLIQNLNLAVLPGQRLAIVGPNGSGKTTLACGRPVGKRPVLTFSVTHAPKSSLDCSV